MQICGSVSITIAITFSLVPIAGSGQLTLDDLLLMQRDTSVDPFVLQILSSKQLALVFVHAYPYMPILEPILDTIATREGYSSHEDVVASAQRDPMTAAWRDFDVYAMYIHQNMFSEERSIYVPLSRHTASPTQAKPCHPNVITATPFIFT